MEALLSAVIGGLYAAGFYSMLRRSTVRLALGMVLLSHATNLTLFLVNGVRRASPPILPKGAEEMPAPFSDPLPQAFILTAIVINLGMLALLLVLVHRAERAVGSDDNEVLRSETEDLGP